MRKDHIAIPVPRIAPIGVPVTAQTCRDVWDVFVKPIQDRGEVQSVEERALMAILRAVYRGLGGTDTGQETRQ